MRYFENLSKELEGLLFTDIFEEGYSTDKKLYNAKQQEITYTRKYDSAPMNISDKIVEMDINGRRISIF